jgi:hypothetical protein
VGWGKEGRRRDGKEKKCKGERTEIQRERSEGEINCGLRERGKEEGILGRRGRRKMGEQGGGVGVGENG